MYILLHGELNVESPMPGDPNASPTPQRGTNRRLSSSQSDTSRMEKRKSQEQATEGLEVLAAQFNKLGKVPSVGKVNDWSSTFQQMRKSAQVRAPPRPPPSVDSLCRTSRVIPKPTPHTQPAPVFAVRCVHAFLLPPIARRCAQL
eukprot:3433908-Prymnesium_polylepis.1